MSRRIYTINLTNASRHSLNQRFLAHASVSAAVLQATVEVVVEEATLRETITTAVVAAVLATTAPLGTTVVAAHHHVTTVAAGTALRMTTMAVAVAVAHQLTTLHLAGMYTSEIDCSGM